MGLPNLSGSLIQDTYRRIIHIDTDGKIYNGAGQNPTMLSTTGNISASGTVSGITGSFPHIVTTGGTIEFVDNFSSKNRIGSLKYDLTQGFELRNQADDGRQKLKLSTLDAESIIANESITSSGYITASGNIYATEFHGDGSNLTGVTAEWDGTHTGTATFTGNITASGDISSSNMISSSNLHITDNAFVDGVLSTDRMDAALATVGGGALNILNVFHVGGAMTATHITASGDVRSSGKLYFNEIEGGTF